MAMVRDVLAALRPGWARRRAVRAIMVHKIMASPSGHLRGAGAGDDLPLRIGQVTGTAPQ